MNMRTPGIRPHEGKHQFIFVHKNQTPETP